MPLFEYRCDRCGRVCELLMAAKEFDFWQDHSLRYLKMAFRTDRRAVVAHPDGYGKRTGDCAELAAGPLYQALRDYQDNQRAPWKKLYPRK